MYDTWSATYDSDRNLTRDLAGSLLRQKLDGVRIDAIVEAGCGTGGNTFFLASLATRLIALDFSEGMLSVVREKARQQLPDSDIEFHRADLTQPWPLPDAAANLVVCALVLEHIDDLSPVFSEAHRVLKKEGSFLVFELHPERQLLGGRATFESEGQKHEIPAFVHSIDQFRMCGENGGFTGAEFEPHAHPEDTGKPPRILFMKFT